MIPPNHHPIRLVAGKFSYQSSVISYQSNAFFGVVKLKDDPNQLGTEITLIARIAWHLSYSDLTTPFFLPSPCSGAPQHPGW